ncbi:unnamed protein product, partial [Urochloa humidicola]
QAAPNQQALVAQQMALQAQQQAMQPPFPAALPQYYGAPAPPYPYGSMAPPPGFQQPPTGLPSSWDQHSLASTFSTVSLQQPPQADWTFDTATGATTIGS